MDCVLRTFLYVSNIFVEDTSEKGMYKFKSEYHEDDICEALEDIFTDKIQGQLWYPESDQSILVLCIIV